MVENKIIYKIWQKSMKISLNNNKLPIILLFLTYWNPPAAEHPSSSPACDVDRTQSGSCYCVKQCHAILFNSEH